MAGRSKEVPDEDFLLVFVTATDPVLVASELAEALGMSRQGAHARLVQLEDDGLLESWDKAGARVFQITDEGKEHLANQ